MSYIMHDIVFRFRDINSRVVSSGWRSKVTQCRQQCHQRIICEYTGCNI